MQTLKFVIISRAAKCFRNIQYCGDRVRVVGCELRVDAICHAEQFARVADVADVGVLFCGEDREAVDPFDLGAFNLGVPIGAFDQAHHDFTVKTCGDGVQVVEHKRGALTVGLHNDAKAIPAFERGLRQNCFDDV